MNGIDNDTEMTNKLGYPYQGNAVSNSNNGPPETNSRLAMNVAGVNALNGGTYGLPQQARVKTDVMRQKYHALSSVEQKTIRDFKEQAAALYDLIESFGYTRETSLAKTHIEEAVMWTVKHLTGLTVVQTDSAATQKWLSQVNSLSVAEVQANAYEAVAKQGVVAAVQEASEQKNAALGGAELKLHTDSSWK